jgi:hypothetical protein
MLVRARVPGSAEVLYYSDLKKKKSFVLQQLVKDGINNKGEPIVIDTFA